MKLTKYKVGILSLAMVFSAALLLGAGPAALGDEISGDTLTIEDTGSIKDYTGDYLSEILGDPSSPVGPLTEDEIASIETIEIDGGADLVQTASLTIDIPVTVKPTDSFDTVTLEQTQATEDYEYAVSSDTGYSGEPTAAIFVASDGVTLKSLEFDNSTVDIESAISVDCCIQGNEELVFENLNIGDVHSFDFDYGIKFDGEAQDEACGIGGGISYTDGITIKDVVLSVDGVDGDGSNTYGPTIGIYFTNNVSDVENVNIEKIYAGDMGAGIFFANSGILRDVTIKDSPEDGASVFNRTPGLLNNDIGIRIDGTQDEEKDTFWDPVGGVTDIEDFTVRNVSINRNDHTGILVAASDKDEPLLEIDGFSVLNSEIIENGRGILMWGYEYSEDDEELTITETPHIKLYDVSLDGLDVYHNKFVGALFYVMSVSGTKDDPALTVADSQFNPDDDDADATNNQDSGLGVDAWEDIAGVSISSSTFHGHTGPGILLTNTEGDDDIEGVTVDRTSARYNGSSGLNITAPSDVEDVEITHLGRKNSKFSHNDEHGIVVEGANSVQGLTVEGRANTGAVLANYNDGYGLLVESKKLINGVDVKNARFGESDAGNGSDGIKLLVDGSNGAVIGGEESEEAVSFANVHGIDNGGDGLEINSAEEFLNHEDNVVVADSEFSENDGDGFRLTAPSDVENPRIEDSYFLGNNTGSTGIYVNSYDVSGGNISGNVVADNIRGIEVGDLTEEDGEEPFSSVSGLTLENNTTEYPNEDNNGNAEKTMYLTAADLNVEVLDNRFIGFSEAPEGVDVGERVALHLESCDSCENSEVLVQGNVFDSEIGEFCQADGTAIRLNALGTTIRKNDIRKHDVAIEVMQDEEEGNSNHINQNNILGCCTLIDARDAEGPVDATENYWGAGLHGGDMDADDLADNMEYNTSAYDSALDQISVEPLLTEPVDIGEEDDLEINISITPEEPGVDETVELEYELVNNTGSSIDIDEVQLTLIDADDEYIEEDKVLETDVSVSASDSETFTYEFSTTSARGDYEAEIVAGGYTESLTFEVGVVEPEEKKPFWGDSANASESGILPAPINAGNDETPFLELANEDGDSVLGYVTVQSVKVFDRTGKRLLVIEDDFQDMEELEDLNNDLYCYTVEYKLNGDEETKSSPLMRFVVQNK